MRPTKCIAEADLILTLGSRFSDRVALKPDQFGKKAKILQVDIDKSEIGKNVAVADCISRRLQGCAGSIDTDDRKSRP